MSKASLWDVDWDKVIEERFGVDVETLSRYAEAHKDGKAFTVSCRLGDALFQVSDCESGIEELVCERIEIAEKDGAVCPVVFARKCKGESDVVTIYPAAFGFYVFTRRKDAVATLRRKLRCGMCISGTFQQYSPECETCQYNRQTRSIQA